MQKLLLTTYRKLLHMCSTVDASVSLRSCLVCVPAVVYDHHAYEWTRIDVREVMTLSESELYLDALVRRLNNNRQYYVPPTAEELTDVTTTTTATSSSSSSSSTSAKSDIEAGSSSSSSSSVGGVRARSGDKRASAQTSASPPPPLPTVPLSLRAYTPLRRALRVLYEQTPYSISRVNDAFAAVKLLSYVCARTPCDDEHVKQQSHEVQQKDRQQHLAPLTPPEALRALSTPPLTRLLLPLSVYSPAMAHGVTAELRRALRVRSGAAATTSTAAKAGASDDASKPPASEATSAASAAAVTDDASTSAHDVQEEEEAEGGSAAAANTTSSTTTTSNASPEHVQLLLAHPMLDGFFANTVQLLVRNTPHEAAALTLNKPLVNEKGVFMRVCDTIRYTRVHPIFQQHLSQHVLMIGGPVMVSGTFDESIFLLHRVAGVAEATPVAEGLWLDGNLDALAAQLSAGVADASRDVVVLCGFAGWAREQLAGEVRGGTWVVAHTPAAHTHVADMLMALTRTAAHGAKALRSSEAAVAAAVKATMQTQEVHEKQQQQEQQQQQQQQQREDDDDEDDAVMSRERAVRRVVRTWAWVYELLGAPYTALGHNQRIERGD